LKHRDRDKSGVLAGLERRRGWLSTISFAYYIPYSQLATVV